MPDAIVNTSNRFCLDGPDKSENLSCDRKLCEKCLAQPFYIA